MTTILSLLFLKINVGLFSQNLTDSLAQFYHNFIKFYTPHLLIKFYILNASFNLIRIQFSLFTLSLFYFRFVKMLYSLQILPGNSK